MNLVSSAIHVILFLSLVAHSWASEAPHRLELWARLGDTVTIPCELPISEKPSPHGRSSLHTNLPPHALSPTKHERIFLDRKNRTMTIKNLTTDDEGETYCMDSSVAGRKHVITELHVVPHRPSPEIEQENIVRMPMGDSIELRCTSVGSEPAPSLRWLDEDGTRIPANATQGTGKYDVISSLRLTMTPQIIGSSFRCIADFSEYPDLANQESSNSVQIFNKMANGKTVTQMKCSTPVLS